MPGERACGAATREEAGRGGKSLPVGFLRRHPPVRVDLRLRTVLADRRAPFSRAAPPVASRNDRPAAGTTSATRTSPTAGTLPHQDRAPARPRTEPADTRGPEGRRCREAALCRLPASGPRRAAPGEGPAGSALDGRAPRFPGPGANSYRSRRAGTPGSARPPEAAAPRAGQSAQKSSFICTPHPVPRGGGRFYTRPERLRSREGAFTARPRGRRRPPGGPAAQVGGIARPGSSGLRPLQPAREMCHASRSGAGWSRLAARRAHNPKVGGSNPPPATKSRPAFPTRGCRPLHLHPRFPPARDSCPAPFAAQSRAVPKDAIGKGAFRACHAAAGGDRVRVCQPEGTPP